MMKSIILPLCLTLAPCTLTAQEAAPAVPASTHETAAPAAALTAEQQAIVDNMVTLVNTTVDETKNILLTVMDKESADAAAPRIHDLLQTLDNAWASLPEELVEPVRQRLCTEVDMAKGREVQEIVEDLMFNHQPPFYGSRPLMEQFCYLDEVNVNVATPGSEPATEDAGAAPAPQGPVISRDAATGTEEVQAPEAGAPAESATTEQAAAYTQEQYAAACNMMDEFLLSAHNVKTVLLGITDKESADAAAGQLDNLLYDFDARWEEVAAWAMSEDTPDELVADIEQIYGEQLEALSEMDDLLMQMLNNAPPFFGSEALANVFMPMEESGDEPAEPQEPEAVDAE